MRLVQARLVSNEFRPKTLSLLARLATSGPPIPLYGCTGLLFPILRLQRLLP